MHPFDCVCKRKPSKRERPTCENPHECREVDLSGCLLQHNATSCKVSLVNAANTTANENLTRTLFTVAGVQHELVTHVTGNGRIEVYVEYADGCGLMQWRGYYDQVCVTDRALSERVHPMLAQHEAARREFWKNGYLPGAEKWLGFTGRAAA